MTLQPEKLKISGISGQDIGISSSFLHGWGKTGEKVKIYVCDGLKIDYDAIFGLDFLETYKCVIDIPKGLLHTSFNTLKLIKNTEEQIKNKNNNSGKSEEKLKLNIGRNPIKNQVSTIAIDARCIQQVKLTTDSKNGTYICPRINVKTDRPKQELTSLDASETNDVSGLHTMRGRAKSLSEHRSTERDSDTKRGRDGTEQQSHNNKARATPASMHPSNKIKTFEKRARSAAMKPEDNNTSAAHNGTAIATSKTHLSHNETRASKRDKGTHGAAEPGRTAADSEIESVHWHKNEARAGPSTQSSIHKGPRHSKTNGEVYEIAETGQIIIPEAVVTVFENTFYTTVVNTSEHAQQWSVPPIELRKVDNPTVIHSIAESECRMDKNVNRRKEIQNNLRLNHLNGEERDHVLRLCLKYPEIFFLEGDRLTFTNEIKHEINLHDPKPVFTKNYRYPYAHKQEVKEQINKMLDQGIIRPSDSPWSAPVWVVPKKLDASGIQKWRIVIDYRKLNEKTIKDRYPLPNITDLLDQLGKCKYFSTIDLCSGFHQIQVKEEDISKTAFTVENGHYEHTRLPMGLSNSPSTFSRLMDNIMTGLQGEQCLVYMDDIIVYSSTLEEHLDRLDNVFHRLASCNLKIQPDKCEFLRKEVAYLGHIVTPEGIKPNPAKIEAVTKYPQPKTPREIKQFLGLTGFYRRFLPNYADLVKPLTKLLKKNIKFNFDEKCTNAFERCKILLTTAPILQYPDFEKDFIVSTDASQNAIGAVLSQGELNEDLPISYASRTLNPAETRYSVIERELLAIVWACKHYRPYLYGRKFILYSDHKPLQWLFHIKDPGSRLVRWRLKLAEYDYEIKYKTGSSNTNADALSRIQINAITQLTRDIINTPIQNEIIEYSDKFILHHKHQNIVYIASDTHIQSNSGSYNAVKRLIEKDVPSFPNLMKSEITELKSVSQANRRYFMLNCSTKSHDKLYNDLIKNRDKIPKGDIHINFIDNIYIDRILSLIFKNGKDRKFIICKGNIQVPKIKDIPDLIKHFHTAEDNYHKGVNETIRKLKTRFYWKNLTKDVTKYIRSCETCAKSKICRQSLKRPLTITDTPIKPFDKVYIDIFEYNKTKYLTLLDAFTKYAQCYAVKRERTKEIIQQLMLFTSHHPIPTQIITDNGSCFTSKEFQEFCNRLNINLRFTSAYHAQSNAVERLHATLADSLRCYTEEHPTLKENLAIPMIIRTYNNCRSTSTHFTPFELIYGDLNLHNYVLVNEDENIRNKPGNYRNELLKWQKKLHEIVKNNIITHKERSKIYHDNKYKINKTNFKIGDLVMIRNPEPNKNQPRFLGPFQILGLSNETTAIIKQNFKPTPIHFDRIKIYIPESDENLEDSSDSEDEIPLSRLVRNTDRETEFSPSSQENPLNATTEELNDQPSTSNT